MSDVSYPRPDSRLTIYREDKPDHPGASWWTNNTGRRGGGVGFSTFVEAVQCADQMRLSCVKTRDAHLAQAEADLRAWGRWPVVGHTGHKP